MNDIFRICGVVCTRRATNVKAGLLIKRSTIKSKMHILTFDIIIWRKTPTLTMRTISKVVVVPFVCQKILMYLMIMFVKFVINLIIFVN